MSKLFKDIFFTTNFINDLTKAVREIYPKFNADKFKARILDNNWKGLELKEKMRKVSTVLHDFLPSNYPDALEILLQVGPQFKGFDSMIFPDYVECYGLKYPEISLPALEVFTRCCSAEFAIRPFIIKYPQETMNQMYKWADNDSEIIRRLASEGCRPRLPWGMSIPALIKDPSPILPILKKLKNDPSEMVRRSVANNINDISKDHPDFVLDLCISWYGKDEQVNKLVKHACRTLLKKGNKRAMLLFGFVNPDDIEVKDLLLSNTKPKIGDKIYFQFIFNVKTNKDYKIRLEYAVFYKKKSDKAAKKVFQIKESIYNPGRYNIKRSHSFKDITTRKHYPGEHALAIIVNGIEKIRIAFELLK